MKDTEGQESVIQEITELRRKIRKLEQLRSSLWLRGEILDESERLYVSLAEQSSDPLYLLCDGRIEYVNSAFLKLFNLSRDEVQAPDFDFFSLIAPESLDFIEDRLQKAIRGEKLESPYAFSALTRSGRRI